MYIIAIQLNFEQMCIFKVAIPTNNALVYYGTFVALLQCTDAHIHTHTNIVVPKAGADDSGFNASLLPVTGTHRVPTALVAVRNSPSHDRVSSHKMDCPILACLVLQE